MVDRVGFEPTMPEGGRFTVCWHEPLAHLSNISFQIFKEQFFYKKFLTIQKQKGTEFRCLVFTSELSVRLYF